MGKPDLAMEYHDFPQAKSSGTAFLTKNIFKFTIDKTELLSYNILCFRMNTRENELYQGLSTLKNQSKEVLS